MDNKETREWMLKRIEEPRNLFSWVTDGCGYDQHIKFVKHRNENWKGGSEEEWKKFVIDYANSL